VTSYSGSKQSREKNALEKRDCCYIDKFVVFAKYGEDQKVIEDDTLERSSK